MAAGTFIIVSALVGGCGGRSEKMTGGHGADQQESVCRKFAAWYTTENDEVTCDFEREALSLRCESTEFGVTTTTYATIDDAVGDNRPLGKITYSRRTLVVPEVIITETMGYDAAGRPTSSRPTIEETPPVENASHGSYGFEYTAWDAEKRPTQAYVTIVYEGPGRPPGGCAGQDETREYDDANRRYVVTRPDGGGPLCQGFVTTWTFDADGILIEEAFEREGLAVARNTQTTLETGEICRD
jgi:hypothetical protein